MKLSVRQIVVAGMLGGIAIFLGATRLGFIPVPTPAGHATIMHLPVIIGAIMEGPLVGTLIGFIFGLYSLLNATVPFFADPLVAILPRLFIGVAAYGAYQALGKGKKGLVAAAVAGTAANTIGVLGMILLRGYLPWPVVSAIAVTNGIPEIIVAIILVVLIMPAVTRVARLSPTRERA